ncbi:MAG TPA: PAS domain S-box protein, partial [Terriglobales bacterium]|nr:PAS domain S-box protein [Terriglobales bacterium]
KKPGRARNALQAFAAALAASVSLAGLIGYVLDVPTAYSWGNLTPIAAPTAVGMLALGAGVVAFAWGQSTSPIDVTPPWSAVLAAMAVTTVSVALWQALNALHAEPAIGWLTLGAGLLQAVLLYSALHLLRSTRERAGQLRQLNSALQMELAERERAEQCLRYSEERYRALLVAIAQVVWTTPPDGLVEDMPMWRGYTGQSIEEVRGWGWLNAIHPDDRERTEAIWRKAVETRGLYETEYRIRCADGQYRHFAIRGVPVLEDDRRIREWVGICTDIHERKQIEDELRKQAALLSLAHDAIIVSDLQYRITFWNRGAEETYGWSTKEAVGRFAPELLQTEFPVPTDNIRAVLNQHGEWEGELKHRTRDGRSIVVASRWSLQRDHHGAPANVLEINRDITESNRAEEALRQSENRNRRLLESLTQGVFLKDRNCVYVSINEGYCRLVGLQIHPADLVGKTDFDLYPRDLAEKYTLDDKRIMESGKAEEIEDQIAKGDGTRIVVQVVKTPFRDENGEVIGLLGIFWDITERKRAEEELRLNRERLQLAQKVGRSGTFDWDILNNINSWSPEIEELYGLSPGGFAGTFEAWERLVSPADMEQARAAITESLKTGEFQGEWRIVRPSDGEMRWLAARAKVLFDKDRQPSHMIGINIDITERKQLEDRLRQRTLELENSVAELEAFSYSVSHDLRAPLRTIDGFSQILLEDYRDKVDPEGQDSLRRIRNASQNMAQLIDALLQLSRVMRSALRHEPVDLSILALSTAAMIQKAEPARRVRFHVANGLQAHGDRRLLGVALQNLLQNAWKFSARNPEPSVEFGSALIEGKPAYFVRDNGIGFDMTYVDKLFTPFQRLHAKEKFEGTGIGLATVQRVIKRHGGKVWAEGAVGKGATFYFSLD